MSKWIDPKFITVIASVIAVYLNKIFGWHISIDKLVASIFIVGNFLVMQIIIDIQKMKNGEKITFNSTKFFTAAIACLILFFSEYLGIPIDEQEVMVIAGLVMAYITAKGAKDVSFQKQKAADIQAEGNAVQEAAHITSEDVSSLTQAEIYERAGRVHTKMTEYANLLQNGNEVQSEEAARRYVMVDKILSEMKPIEREVR
ncbi:hypothetical protein [Paenibacillus lutrae]|uniref:Uncharacterized protein n=1 Tax=Paenibacillus lutrae TaxID=2078573 RepID=A0A7X3JZM4_9BACL|nr:hypothetical protein [Paenibacillus lutrae]MVP00339.1 hypothetical protein [Paenibacillus lutrae]